MEGSWGMVNVVESLGHGTGELSKGCLECVEGVCVM